jgi:glycosyltransferase involved in cell wall biosynthesis
MSGRRALASDDAPAGRLRILRVIATLSPAAGGPVEGLSRSTEALARMGHATEVACLDPPGAPWLARLPMQVHALGPRTRAYGYSPRLVPWLRANRDRFDAVIAHGVWNYASVGTWRGLAGGTTPYFVFTHGMLDPWFRASQPVKWWAKQAFWWAVEGRVLAGAAGVLFTTEEERRLARSAYVGYRYRERVVAYGSADAGGDAGRQAAAFRDAVPALGGRRCLLFLSRIHPKKGCDLLIEAFAAVAGRHPDLDLVMAGPDQTGWRADLERLAAARGVAGRIHWPGLLTGDAKWGAFRSAEAFVLPSHQENFGIVVAEAMACQKLVLITDKVNIWREVEASGGGLVGPDDLAGTRDLLERFLALSAADRTAMGERARAAFLERFSIEGAATDLVAALTEAR